MALYRLDISIPRFNLLIISLSACITMMQLIALNRRDVKGTKGEMHDRRRRVNLNFYRACVFGISFAALIEQRENNRGRYRDIQSPSHFGSIDSATSSFA